MERLYRVPICEVKMPPVIVWFRRDLRLIDNPALCAALKSGATVIPLFIWSYENEGEWPLGGAAKWWLHSSLYKLNLELKKIGSRLILRAGDPLVVLKKLLKETGAKEIYFSRRYEPHALKYDTKIIQDLQKMRIQAKTYDASLLFEPWDLSTPKKTPYQAFAPFWKKIQNKEPPLPLQAPKQMPIVALNIESVPLAKLRLEPFVNWTTGLKSRWQPGEEGACNRLYYFIENHLNHYAKDRDRPDKDAGSCLSAHLHFGEISPRHIWHAVTKWMPTQVDPKIIESCWTFLAQLGWREFAYHVLHHFPSTPSFPFNHNFNAFPWKENEDHFAAWKAGKTGYPIIDAAMRELWITGWMHGRTRLIVSSFLTKDLLIPWQHGARWFWDTLVDADLASNILNWQSVAGCGPETPPYTQFINPTVQGEKFDPDGTYIKRWLPELSKLGHNHIHRPWTASPIDLELAGVELGVNYPHPIIEHEKAKKRALTAYHHLAEV